MTSTQAAIAMGEGSYVEWNMGLSKSKNTNIYIPATRDVHFIDAHTGTVAANGFTVRKTSDGGNTWQEVTKQHRPLLAEGEASFAASGGSDISPRSRRPGSERTCATSAGASSTLAPFLVAHRFFFY